MRTTQRRVQCVFRRSVRVHRGVIRFWNYIYFIALRPGTAAIGGIIMWRCCNMKHHSVRQCINVLVYQTVILFNRQNVGEIYSKSRINVPRSLEMD